MRFFLGDRSPAFLFRPAKKQTVHGTLKTIPINGLSFATRCQYADGEYKKSLPPLRIFEEGTGKGASMSGLMTGPGFAVFELTSRRCRC